MLLKQNLIKTRAQFAFSKKSEKDILCSNLFKMKLNIVALLILSGCLLASASKCRTDDLCEFENARYNKALCIGRQCCWDDDARKCYSNSETSETSKNVTIS